MADFNVSQTNTAPWATQQPFLQKGFETAQGLLQGGTPSYYPNATYVPQSGATSGSLLGGENAAWNQWNATNYGTLANLTPEAMNQTYSMARGDQLTQQNPYFQQMLQQTYQSALPTIQNTFAGAGRGISGASDAATADAWAKAASGLGYQDYSRERQNQIGAIAASPGMAQAGLAPLQQLSQIGQTREGYAGKELQDAINRYDFGQNSGWSNAAKYMSLIGGGGFGQQKTEMVPQTESNPWATAAGVGTTAASLLGSLFGRNGVFR
jgi:hypothetical protein